MNPEIHEQKKFLRSITKDYIDLQESNQDNILERILSREELNIKLQKLLDQIKAQTQTLQGQFTLEEAYKNYEYSFLFKRARVIHETINNNKLTEVVVQRKYLLQIRKLVEFYITESNLLEYWLYSKKPSLKFEHKNPLRKEIEKFLVSKTDKEENWHFYDRVIKFHQELNTKTLLTLEGARNIQENDQATPIIFPNTGLTQATQNYLLQHHQQLYSEITTPRRNPRGYLQRIGTPIIIEAIGIENKNLLYKENNTTTREL
ncbi:hypothetical protein C2G38_2256977 [Gigaspora rosea]|uniref:Uncharacterized protein n=1 Tax=Gigaspora rosea TaxID=44941 RepID=A0A397TU56_9GLOM|nr:hypothetical protein C2G38_2256977 [Gigaspora rosea]